FNDGVNLNIVVSGNLETNFNKLVLFFDNGNGGGFNPLGTGHASGDDFGYINTVGGQGLTFDNAFSPQSALWVRAGFDGSNNTMYGTFATLGAAGTDTTANVPVNLGAPWTLGFGNGINTALNNVNTAGVTGGTGAASGAGVLTGFEAMIPLSAIGASAGSTIRVGGYITGGSFMSNQVIGGLPAGTGNLGNGAIDFNQYAGNQFVTVQGVPEPGTMIALGAGLAAFAARRRRK
ncbi:MAG: PEP-CTERM sorting domain-containing protein, partial [Fimbriimonadaceae bacterium]|nr:PEP-CTERM sorting domain-containing protein [Fimbriimonadaceae bacterium]